VADDEDLVEVAREPEHAAGRVVLDEVGVLLGEAPEGAVGLGVDVAQRHPGEAVVDVAHRALGEAELPAQGLGLALGLGQRGVAGGPLLLKQADLGVALLHHPRELAIALLEASG
jgi:hypothetical protein